MTARYHMALVLLALFAFSAGRAHAQNTALGFIRIERSPRTSAFAGAGSASVGNGAYAAFENAATLPSLSGLGDVAAGVQLWEMSNEVDKTTNLQAAAGFRFGRFGAALGAAWQMGVPVGTFNPSDLLVSLGLSYNIYGTWSLGINARYALQKFTQTASVGGFSADISVFGRIGEEFSVIGGVAALGPKVKGSAAEYSQPSYVHAGVAWNKALAPEHGIELMLDAEYGFAGSPAAAIGTEYTYDHMVFVRAGYRLSGKKSVIPSHLALGLGICIQGFRADVSWLTASPVLGNTLNIGVGYQF